MAHNQDVKIAGYWNTQYENGKYAGQPIHPEVYQFLANYILPGQGMKLDQIKILEIGSGNGKNIIPMVELGMQVFGIELSDIGLDQTLEKLIYINQHARVIYGDFRELPWRNDYFDAVIAFNVLQHGDFPDCQLAVAEAARTLKKDGYLFISVRSSKRNPPKDACIYKDSSQGGISFISKTDKSGIILHHWHDSEIHFIARENGLEIIHKEEYSKGVSDNGIEKWHWNVVLQKK
ncbi:MAG: class I SAM-dependent methyltransferase [Patescibacteria group bacterium]|nr:class I SAM-dependent methyltransferase [Patescibacteria group bacterium]MDD4304839.1 class I SAM-dependent methyltransferase [Patescibacteria group bacterium]MDD4695824.1 class I SAM-dependent methyltransferase [Patescibacteria group bacterium]